MSPSPLTSLILLFGIGRCDGGVSSTQVPGDRITTIFIIGGKKQQPIGIQKGFNTILGIIITITAVSRGVHGEQFAGECLRKIKIIYTAIHSGEVMRIGTGKVDRENWIGISGGGKIPQLCESFANDVMNRRNGIGF